LVELRRLAESARKDNLPELEQFGRRWGIAFPLPPSMPLVIEELLISGWCRPVRVVQHSAPRYSAGNLVVPGKLVLEVCYLAGTEITLGCVGAAIHNCSRKRKRGRVMAGRMVSRKPIIQSAVDVIELVSSRLKVDLSLPTDQNVVLEKLRDSLGRTQTSWRNDREYYRDVFRSFDLRRQGVELKHIGGLLANGLKDANQASDRLNTFRDLVHMFGFDSST
jgi:hypothetical protein